VARDRKVAAGPIRLFGEEPLDAAAERAVAVAAAAAAPLPAATASVVLPAPTATALPPVPEAADGPQGSTPAGGEAWVKVGPDAWSQPGAQRSVPAAPAAPLGATTATAEPAGRPAPLPSLKRMHSAPQDAALGSAKITSSALGKLSPLGFGSPMLGFDLMSFVEAVSTAVDEESAPPAVARRCSEALTFEVSEVPMLRTSVSERVSFSSKDASYDASTPANPPSVDADDAEAESRIPGGLGLLSALLTGFAALTVCASLKAAASTRLR